MDKTSILMHRAASTLAEMKNSILDKPTAKRLRKLIYKNDIEIIHEQQEQEPEQEPEPEEQEPEEQEPEHEDDVEEALPNHEIMENANQKQSCFGVNPKFIKKLQCGQIRVESLILPPLGQAIDRIVLPKLPPIETLQGKIGNCSAPFEKQLTPTDLDEGQGRLSFCKMAVEEILKPMLRTGEDLKVGIEVTVYDEKGRGFNMHFKFWSDKIYVLTMGWKFLFKENELKPLEDWVTIWMFRRNETDELCFAIILRRFPITKLIGKVQKKGSKSDVKKEKEKEKKISSFSRQD